MRHSLYIVEDDPDTMVALVRALGHRACGCTLLGAVARAEFALDALDRARVDLIITDYRLATDMDGIELTTRVKQQSPTTHILLITGFGDPGITRRAVLCGSFTSPFPAARS